ncbi:OB-fold nucleic acid binding domain-containing protein [Aeoliella sp. ICT_H6.2]|uniref:OB-fold nucleic acid binding domain-containing protein n=1 Tax=Aeoliella straminimaris TaxID=2954799 RepID=A0A9X2JID8_9BACT|nr:HD domain-containing protein [Aeoliella straminimaris]MCO6046736.1 OB-fold nucleic acid binding domain-containing protein [Aeoliella straminimaris]
MSRRYATQLAHNEHVHQTFLASDKNLRPNRNGNYYLQLQLADRSGSIDSRLWNASEKDYKDFDNGDYVLVDGSTQLFQGNMQLIINSIRRARPDEVDEGDFMVRQPAEIDQYATRLAELLRGIKTPELKNLAECFLMDDEFMKKFTTAPAGMKNHHAYKGGLLEHVVSVMELVLLVAPRYPQIDEDKLLIGAFLHDASKIDELSYDREIGYTDEGQLLGHMVMAMSLLDSKIVEAERLSGEPFPKPLAIEIKHMIISHHGEYEYGSAKLPMTLEAVALHHLDNLDAKINSFGTLIADCPNSDSNWTQYFGNLGRKLYKGVTEE